LKLSATMTIRLIVDDVLSMFPQQNFMETMAINAFKARLLRLTEQQSEQILEKVKRRLILNDPKPLEQ
jgi:hypothetical protein